jgi:putative ABC transport system permease protein
VTSFFAIIIALALLGYVALAVLAWRRPLLVRLAVREATRRPGQSAIAVAGLMVGTAAIFCMEIGADSVVASGASGAELSWGRVDLTISDGGSAFDEDVARSIAADDDLAGLVAGAQGGIELVGSAADLEQETGQANVRLIGFDPSAQAPFGPYILADGRQTDGTDLASDEVLLSRSLADGLDAQLGDRLTISGGSATPVSVAVAGIALPEGPGAYGLRPAVYAPNVALAPLLGPGMINIVRVAARADTQTELAAGHAAVPRLRDVVASIPGSGSLVVREDKATDIEAAVRSGEIGREWQTAYGFFVAVAGIALVVNLVVAIADDRRPRHAALRAMGLTRSGLVVLSLLEGAVYSVVAAVLGLIVGAVAAIVLVAQLPDFWYTPISRVIPAHLAIQPISAVFAVAAGSLIVLLTMLVASVRTSRMVISAAIKDLPSPSTGGPPGRWQTALLLVVGASSVALLISPESIPRVIGGTGLIATLAMLASGRISDRRRATLTGGALAAWGLIGMARILTGVGSSGPAAALAGFVAIYGLSIIVATNLQFLELLTQLVAVRRGSLQAALRPPLAYVGRRPVRTGLGVAAFGSVVLALSLMATLRGTYDRNLDPDAKRYDLRVATATTPDLRLPASVSGVARETSFASHAYRGDVQFEWRDGGRGVDHDQLISLFGLTDAQIANPPVQLWRWEDRYGSEEDVWRALGEDSSLLVSSTYAFGSDLTFAAKEGGLVRRHVAAIFSPLVLVGLAGSAEAIAPLALGPGGTTILVGLTPGSDVESTARTIERQVYTAGADVRTMADLLTDARRGISFINVVYLLFGMGLLIGVASLGILSIRAVVERRRSTGVLRAMGYSRSVVVGGMLVEATLMATCGLVVGLAAGLAGGHLWARELAGVVPGGSVGLDTSALIGMVAFVYGAVLLVTIGPAVQASRVVPAEALRLLD